MPCAQGTQDRTRSNPVLANPEMLTAEEDVFAKSRAKSTPDDLVLPEVEKLEQMPTDSRGRLNATDKVPGQLPAVTNLVRQGGSRALCCGVVEGVFCGH